MIKRFFFFVPALIFLYACSSTVYYSITVPLGKESFSFKNNSLGGAMPLGWFSSEDTSSTNPLQLWLLRDDLSAGIVFRELQIDSKARTFVEDDGLEFLALLSKQFILADSAVITVPTQEFKLGTIDYFGYEVQQRGIFKRIVVFVYGDSFYECETATLQGAWDSSQLKELFATQQTVLSSLKPIAKLP